MQSKHSDTPIKLKDANEQGEAVKLIMKERKIPFEKAVDVYIKQREKDATKRVQSTNL